MTDNAKGSGSALKKTVKDIKKDELEKLMIPLGIRGRPYPMRDSGTTTMRNGERVYVQRLGVLEDDNNPLMVYSERDYIEAVGMAYREMPTPGMLPMFFDAINRRQPGSKRCVQFMKGDPGSGKSHMGKLLGKMRHKDGALVVDCGGKNLSELLFETVLDFNSQAKFYDELDKRIRNKTLNPLSVKILKEHLGPAFAELNDGMVVQWDMIGHKINEETGDFDELTDQDMVHLALDGLKKVSHLEGLDALGGNALGMTTQEGPLIQAWKEGQEIVLDEYNKSKDGSDDQLQGVLQFLAGEIDEHTVENKLKDKDDMASQTFSFRREDQKLGFFVTLTGNAEADGTSTRELSKSVNSRLHPQVIPKATEEDWQHRICQILTGVPVSTLYRAAEEQWNENPALFAEKLVEWRCMGLSEDQIKNIPELELKLLRRWEDVLDATEKLAKFYYGWSQLVDPESDAFLSGNLGHLMREVDETYQSEVSVDFRKIIEHIKEAMDMKPDVLDSAESEGFESSGWNVAPNVKKPAYEDPSISFGDRLVGVLMAHVNNTTVAIGKKKLFNQLKQHAEDCGLVEASLKEGMPSERRTVAELLNSNPYDIRNPRIQVQVARDMICDYLRERYPEIKATNDEIISLSQVEAALNDVEDTLGLDATPDDDGFDAQEAGPESQELVVLVNENHDTLSQKPFDIVESYDATPIQGQASDLAEKVENMDLTPAVSELVDQEALLATFIIPRIREINLTNLWNNALSGSGAVAKGTGAMVDESLAMAENESRTGLAVTTVIVSDGGAEGTEQITPLHIVHNTHTNKTMIVGDEISARLRTIFKHCGVSYVNRNDARARKYAHAGLRQVMGERREDLEGSLKMAFLMRNSASAEKEEKSCLAGLLVDKEVNTHLPRYITKRKAELKPKAA